MRKFLLTFSVLVFVILVFCADALQMIHDRYGTFKDKFKDISLYQTIQSEDNEGFFTLSVISLRKGDKFNVSSIIVSSDSTRSYLIGMKTDIVSNGNNTILIMDDTDTTEIRDEDTRNFIYDNLVFWWNLIDDSFTQEKSVKIGNKDCYVVSTHKTVDMDDGTYSAVERYWVDSISMQLIQSNMSNTLDNADDMVFYSDYRELCKSISIPWKIRLESIDGFTMNAVIDSIKVNTGLKEELFKIK